MNEIKKDLFNSEVFGKVMGNICYRKEIDVEKILKIAKKEGFEHLSIKIETNDLKKCNEFLKHGFQIVDTLVTYKLEYEKENLVDYKHSDDIFITSVEESDIETICKIANDSFFGDRFHNDPSLDDSKCNLYYYQWVKNSCNGFADVVFVAKDMNNNILGFVTGKIYSEQESALVLSAVTSLARGKGVYTALIYEVIKKFKGKSKTILTGTQINTYAVQRTWPQLGFKIFDSKYVLHKSLSE